MMKKTGLLLLGIFLLLFNLEAQTRYRQQVDSLKLQIGRAKSEGAKLILFINLLNIYGAYQPDEALNLKIQCWILPGGLIVK